MTTGHTGALIIGIGNEYRHDDSVGLVVARRIRDHAPLGVSITEQSGEGAALLEVWEGHTPVFLLDAIDAGAAPGTIYRMDVNAEPPPARFFLESTHAFSVAHATELARALHQLPSHLLLYGIQGKDFSAGVGLSPEVEQGVGEVVRQVFGELRTFSKTSA
jgi:hydrogenase maturation protease